MKRIIYSLILLLCLAMQVDAFGPFAVVGGGVPAAAGGGNDIVFTNLGASTTPDINSGSDDTSYSSGAWTPPTSGLILACIKNRDLNDDETEATPTVTHTSISFTEIGTSQRIGSFTFRRLTLLGVDASTLTAGSNSTTVDFGAQTQTGASASFVHVAGVDLSGGVAGAIVQSVSNNQSGQTTCTDTLAAAASANNRVYVCSGTVSASDPTADADFTGADDLDNGTQGGTFTEYREDAFDTDPTWDYSTGETCAYIMIELKD